LSPILRVSCTLGNPTCEPLSTTWATYVMGSGRFPP
jgi:hypothetical protein